MSTEIYYFTSTGNSLVVARDIAARTSGTLISIASVVDQEQISTDADVIGMVFPVYYASLGGSGLPRIVERFARKLEGLGTKYLFAVCTHSGGPVDTLENLAAILASRGGELAVGLAIETGIPYAAGAKIKAVLFDHELDMDRAADDSKRQELFAAWRGKLEALQRQIQTRAKGNVALRSAVAKAIGTPWLLFQKQIAMARYRGLASSSSDAFDELIPLADASFDVGEQCTGCGTCARICPVGNIDLVDGQPVWQHRCETCYACFQWCPRGAIGGAIVEYEKRDHHPGVKRSDMLKQARKNRDAPRTPEGEEHEPSYISA